MSRSERLRLTDLRGVFEFVGECEELWDDARLWREHLVEGVAKLVDARVGYSAFNESAASAVKRAAGEPLYTCGWQSDDERAWFEEGIARPITETTPEAIPFFATLPKSGFISTSLHGIMSRTDWERSYAYNEFHRPARIDGMTISLRILPDGQIDHLAASRDAGDRRMTRRHERVIGHLHREISKIVGRRLATEEHVGRHLLTPRLAEVLDLLLEGCSEKEIAQQLHRAQPTIHRHVVELYKRFGVSSRSELLAYYIRRRPRLRPDTP